jgi:hypothetical protein
MAENPTKTNGIEIRKVDADVLVYDSAHDKVHVLNRTAGHVLELCDGQRSPAQIALALSDATSADLAVVGRDVHAILREFVTLQLLTTQP